jgi:hypothetical protein
LDNALNWLWHRVEHTPGQISAQKRWLAARDSCPPAPERSATPVWWEPFISWSERQDCIALSYAGRIKELARRSSPPPLAGGTYTTDEPLDVPRGRYATVAEKLLMARGFRIDEITVEDLGARGPKISGYGVWANGHLCALEASTAETERTGSQLRISDDATAPRDDSFSISLVITPQVVIRVGGAKQFQCGARGGWSDAYFRQPDHLVSQIRGLRGVQ